MKKILIERNSSSNILKLKHFLLSFFEYFTDRLKQFGGWKYPALLGMLIGFTASAFAQDSIDVTFRYKAEPSVIRVMLPGEFNNWGPNNNAVIQPTAPSLMSLENGVWYKNIRLKINGGSTKIGGKNVYQYKIHEHLNQNGSSYNWLSDPLNPQINSQDNNNSYLRVTHPLIFQFEPTNLKVVRNNQPPIIATIAAKNDDPINANDSKIYLNGELVGSFAEHYDSEKQVLFVASLVDYGAQLDKGLNKLKIAAVTNLGATKWDSVIVNFVENPEIVEQPLPAGMVDGINYHTDPTKVTLSLFAPYKKFVYLLGDFNNWTVSAEYFMKRDSVNADSVRWWLTLSGLIPEKEYAFQYFIDDEIRIADPYADKVLDPWNDPYISNDVYPNLIDYPTGKTTEIVSVLQTGQKDYEWEVENFNKPEPEKLVIYELLIRDFIQKHNYKTLIDTLSYLKKLGVNAVELMPVNEFEGNSSWGYNPSFYFALDKYYGPKEDFKAFVDACHSQGIAVILDMVLNHSYGQSPLVRLYNEGLYGKPTVQNPWYNITSPNQTYSWGYDFDHEAEATRRLVDRVNKYWITEYKIDGFRFDFTKGFTNTPGDGSRYDASRINILKRMADAIWSVDENTYIILEHLSENAEEAVLANYGMMMWGNLNHSYNEAAMGWHKSGASYGQSDFSWGYYKSRSGWTKPNLITYMESHDEERLMYKNKQYGNSSGNYSIKDEATALQRQKLVGAFFFTLPGPKMIWQFGELGYDYCIDYNDRVGEKPIKWDYLSDENRNKLYRTWAALIQLRNENEVFTNGSSLVNLDLEKEVKTIKLSGTGLNALIVGNFDVVQQDVNLSFVHAGKWYDFFSGEELTITDSHTHFSYAPGEFHIYTDQKLFTPDEDLLTAIEPSEETVKKKAFQLHQNYPNPFNPATTIRYELETADFVNLNVYNIIGQKIATLVQKKQAAGSYEITFKAASLSSGIYFYEIKTEQFSDIKRMLLLK
jgi:1,4-alpha-glucan branching enzyme